MAVRKIELKKKNIDPWLDEMKDEQRIDLHEVVGCDIEIDKGFLYESKKYGTGFTFRFKLGDGRECFTTTFGAALIRQAREEIIPLLEQGDSVVVRVAKGTSKVYGSEYLYFAAAEED